MSGALIKTAAPTHSIAESEVRLPSASTRTSLLRSTASTVLLYGSYSANRLGKMGVVGFSLVFFSVVVFVSSNLPLRQNLASQVAELNVVRGAAANQRSGTVLETPQLRAATFVENLPTVTDMPRIMSGIVAVAATTGIELERGTYEFVAADGDAIARYQVTLPISGTYPKVREFVENVLASAPSVALESMRIERGKVSDQVISADLKFSILLGGAL